MKNKMIPFEDFMKNKIREFDIMYKNKAVFLTVELNEWIDEYNILKKNYHSNLLIRIREKIKYVLQSIKYFVLLLLVAYLLASFKFVAFNPLEWGEVGRDQMVSIWIQLCAIYVLIYFIDVFRHELNKKEK